MRTISILLLFVLLFPMCQGKNQPDLLPADFKKWEIVLPAPFGTIWAYLPSRMDTLFQWTEHTDYRGGTRCDYRIQPHLLPTLHETGFFYNVLEDSVYQFTIKHLESLDPVIDFQLTPAEALRRLKSRLDYETDRNYRVDTAFRRDGVTMAVVGFEKYDSIKHSLDQQLVASGSVGANAIEFMYENRWKSGVTGRTNFWQEGLTVMCNISFRCLHPKRLLNRRGVLVSPVR